MAVPNVYSPPQKDREQVLKGLALFATLFGSGFNFAYFSKYLQDGDLGPFYPIGLVLVTVLAMASAALLWLEPGWHANHSYLGFVTGLVWILLGFYTLDPYGGVQVILGGLLMGVGFAGLAGVKVPGRPRAKAARTR